MKEAVVDGELMLTDAGDVVVEEALCVLDTLTDDDADVVETAEAGVDEDIEAAAVAAAGNVVEATAGLALTVASEADGEVDVV